MSSKGLRRALLLLLTPLLAGVVGLTACTSGTSGLPAPSTRTGASTGTPTVGMTAVPERVRCTTERPLTNGAVGVLRREDVFPRVAFASLGRPLEREPGPDAADPGRCPATLPREPHCDGVPPWAGLGAADLLVAGRVARQVEVLLVSTRSADADAPNGPGTRVLSYRVLDLA
ncbi:MAG: hypothetical protein ABIR97_00100, partial [Terracoccus sp.]